MSTVKLALASGGVIGGGSTTYAAYEFTKETFGFKVQDDALTDDKSLQEDWKKKETSLKDESSDLKFGLGEVKDSVGETPTGEKLKKWCLEKYKETYKSWFKKDGEELLELIKKHCILSIKDKLGDGKNFDTVEENNAQTTLSNQISKLNEDSTDLTLTPDLLDIKSKSGSNKTEEQAKALLKWCKETYQRGYRGSSDDLWKLADSFCKKS